MLKRRSGLSLFVSFIFLTNCFPCPYVFASDLSLPVPGTMVNLSPAFEPVLIKGLKIHPNNPFQFDFIVDTGNDIHVLNDQALLKEQSSTLIKYFLATLTIPEKDLWVNLSPYEKNRIIAPNLGQTVMGRDMLAEDYILKQLTASLIYPEKNLGKIFWDKIYSKAEEMYGTTQVPINTFNKVWIVADRADIFEQNNAAYVVGTHLKVMLEEDYLAREKHQSTNSSSLSSQVVREIILPEIEQEVNHGENFASLRQMYYSMILATWYKMTLKNALLTQIYANQSKVKIGINQSNPQVNEEIYERYLKAYKKGVFNYIKEVADSSGNETIPRKYFSGGEEMFVSKALRVVDYPPSAKGRIYSENVLISPQSIEPVVGSTQPARLAPVSQRTPDAAMFKKSELIPRLRDQNYYKTAVWLREDVNDLGIPEIRYTVVNTLTVYPAHLEAFLRGIKENKDIVLLNQQTIDKTWGGNFKTNLTKANGIIPEKYLEKKVTVSGKTIEILQGFYGNAADLPKWLEESPKVAFRVNKVFHVLIYDSKEKRYLYFLPFNRTKLEQGKLRLNPLGGGVVFEEGGFDYYKENVDPKIRFLPDAGPNDARVIIQGKNLPRMLSCVSRGIYIKFKDDHELWEELNGENGLFPAGVPAHWLSTSTNGGIDLNSNKMQLNIHHAATDVTQMNFDAATITRFKHNGFEGMLFQIESIIPMNLASSLALSN